MARERRQDARRGLRRRGGRRILLLGRLVIVRQDLAAGAADRPYGRRGPDGRVDDHGRSARQRGRDVGADGKPPRADGRRSSAPPRPRRGNPYVTLTKRRVPWSVHGRPDRVTQLRTPAADSTVATAVMRLLSNRKIQLVLNGGFGLVLLGVAFFSVRHFIGGGWPIHHADPLLVSCAAAPLPRRLRLQGVGLAAALSGKRASDRRRPRVRRRRRVRRRDRPARPRRRRDPHRRREALPGNEGGHRHSRPEPARARDARQRGPHADGVGRCGRIEPLDDARRLRGRRRRRSRRSRGRRLPAADRPPPIRHPPPPRPLARRAHALHEGGVGGLALHLGLVESPRPRRLPPPQRPLDARLLRARARVPRRLRCFRRSPIAPAGAATQAGAGAAILVLGGVGTADAVAFSVAAQALVIVTGAAVMLLIASWQLALRLELAQPRAAAARSGLAGCRGDLRAARDEVLLPHEHEGEDRAREEDERRDEEDRVQAADEGWCASTCRELRPDAMRLRQSRGQPDAIACASGLQRHRAGEAAATGDAIRLWKIAPSAAMPVAIPTWRNVLLIPDAIPARCGSTTLTAVEASGALTRPIPIPPTMKPGMSARRGRGERQSVHQQERDADTARARRRGRTAPGSASTVVLRSARRRTRRATAAGRSRLSSPPSSRARSRDRAQEEELREHPRRDREGGDLRAGERRHAEEPEVEHRRPLPQLDQRERDEQHGRRRRTVRRSRPLDQPQSLPRNSPSTSANSPAVSVRKPGRSKPPASSLRDSTQLAHTRRDDRRSRSGR